VKLRAADYEVRPISGRGRPWRIAKAFVCAYHYSRGCTKTATYVHGLYRRGSAELLGVAVWLPPTKIAAQSVNPDHWQKVLSLSRLAVRSDVPTNGATFLMARSTRFIKQDGRFYSLVTYADEFRGHSGAIYLGANWTPAGTGQKQPRWEDGDGRQVSNRSTTTKTHAQMRAAGHRLVGYYRKHKFIMHLRQRRQGMFRDPIGWLILSVAA
jgi:hypothetical protein